MVGSTTSRSGVHFAFGPSSSCPVLTLFLVPHPPKSEGTSPHLSPAATRSSLRASAHRGHERITCVIVSLSPPHPRFALPSKPPRARYWLSRQWPVLVVHCSLSQYRSPILHKYRPDECVSLTIFGIDQLWSRQSRDFQINEAGLEPFVTTVQRACPKPSEFGTNDINQQECTCYLLEKQTKQSVFDN
jgi:hypothetical protein